MALLSLEGCMFAKHGLYLDGVSWRADLTEKTMLIGFAVRLVLGAVSMTYHAAFLLSMVFGYGGLFPWGFVTCRNGNHA